MMLRTLRIPPLFRPPRPITDGFAPTISFVWYLTPNRSSRRCSVVANLVGRSGLVLPPAFRRSGVLASLFPVEYGVRSPRSLVSCFTNELQETMLMVSLFMVDRSQVIGRNAQITLGAPHWLFGDLRESQHCNLLTKVRVVWESFDYQRQLFLVALTIEYRSK